MRAKIRRINQNSLSDILAELELELLPVPVVASTEVMKSAELFTACARALPQAESPQAKVRAQRTV